MNAKRINTIISLITALLLIATSVSASDDNPCPNGFIPLFDSQDVLIGCRELPEDTTPEEEPAAAHPMPNEYFAHLIELVDELSGFNDDLIYVAMEIGLDVMVYDEFLTTLNGANLMFANNGADIEDNAGIGLLTVQAGTTHVLLIPNAEGAAGRQEELFPDAEDYSLSFSTEPTEDGTMIIITELDGDIVLDGTVEDIRIDGVFHTHLYRSSLSDSAPIMIITITADEETQVRIDQHPDGVATVATVNLSNYVPTTAD